MTDRHSALLAAGEPDDLVFTLQRGHDAGVVATLRELLDRDLLDAEGALDLLSTVALDQDSDVVADFAIDLQATQAHAGIDQPDWATPARGTVCAGCSSPLDPSSRDAERGDDGRWLCPDCFNAACDLCGAVVPCAHYGKES